MGVYSKGMEMPTSCAECLDIGWNYVFECNLDDVESGEKRADCPLVPVPPHGRLIDADALFRKVKTECNPYGKPTIEFESGKKVLEMIENAPTIIEAEEGDG